MLYGGEYWYEVRFGERAQRLVEDDLDPMEEQGATLKDLAAQGAWGQLGAFRTALAVERIRKANRSTVYSYRARRILFEAYQYKPLLRILDSHDRRLLIADEVGLGKTIEAGLILAELDARSSPERVLVVCPSRLRNKWREELNRKFDQDFDFIDGRGVREYALRIQSRPASSRLRAVASLTSLRSESVRNTLRDEVGHLDLVIFDEAHHCRNPHAATSQLLRDLCEISHSVILLSATPIQLRTSDLHTLLNALRPEEFADPHAFDAELSRHSVIHEAARIVRAGDVHRLPEVHSRLRQCFIEGIPTEEQNPIAKQVMVDIESFPPASQREWVDLERRVQELHPLSSIMTRTRKRDVVSNAPKRRATVVECDWTPEESRLYELFVGSHCRDGWFSRRAGLGQVQRARQAASCLPAAIEGYPDHPGADDEGSETSDISLDASSPDGETEMEAIGHEPTLTHDSKFEKLRTVITAIHEKEPWAKVLIFTFFRGTARYLERRLKELGIRTLLISGDVPSDPRRPDRDERGKRVAAFRENASVLAMVSTEVGSEGLDFQFCHHVVNYDLPWNPMVVEQRIGRIDRYGQKSPEVHIWNLVVRGSVEQRILERLYTRIGIFESSIGDLEEILGNTVAELQREYVNGSLRPRDCDRVVDDAARAIEIRRAALDALANKAGDLFGHEEFIREEMKRVDRLGRYVGEESLIAVIGMFLDRSQPGAKLWTQSSSPGIWHLRLTDGLRHAIERAARAQSTVWIHRGDDPDVMQFSLVGDIAFDNPKIELVNAGHPLIRAACDALDEMLKDVSTRTGQALLRIGEADEASIHEGLYYLFVYALEVQGVRSRRLLEVFAWNADKSILIDGELAERILHLVNAHGEEWTREAPAPCLVASAFEAVTAESVARQASIRTREIAENEALYIRRVQSLRAEFKRHEGIKLQRLETARRNDARRILPALEGQLQKLRGDYEENSRRLGIARRLGVAMSPEPIAMCAVQVVRERRHGRHGA
jgi:SNF2 family DNA or RNA helicase